MDSDFSFSNMMISDMSENDSNRKMKKKETSKNFLKPRSRSITKEKEKNVEFEKFSNPYYLKYIKERKKKNFFKIQNNKFLKNLNKLLKRVLTSKNYSKKKKELKIISESSKTIIYEKYSEKIFQNLDFNISSENLMKFPEKFENKKFIEKYNQKLRLYKENLNEDKKEFYELDKKLNKNFELLDDCTKKFSDINFEILKK